MFFVSSWDYRKGLPEKDGLKSVCIPDSSISVRDHFKPEYPALFFNRLFYNRSNTHAAQYDESASRQGFDHPDKGQRQFCKEFRYGVRFIPKGGCQKEQKGEGVKKLWQDAQQQHDKPYKDQNKDHYTGETSRVPEYRQPEERYENKIENHAAQFPQGAAQYDMGKFFPFLFGKKKRNHADHDRPCRKFKQKEQYLRYGNQGQKQSTGQQIPFVKYLFHK
jgi:hypothetical protein